MNHQGQKTIIINILMHQIQGLNRFSKLYDDEDPWAQNHLLKPGTKEKHQFDPDWPSNSQEAPVPTNSNE